MKTVSLCVSVLAALLVVAMTAPVASAHTGEINTVVEAGPYRLVVRALPVAAGPRPALSFRSSISGRRDGGAVDSARVSVIVIGGAGVRSGPFRTTGLAGTYYLLLPIPNASSWRSLRFLIEVDGPLGAASARYVPPDLFDQWLFEPYVFAFAAIAALLFLQGFVRLRRRGRHDHASWSRLVLFGLGLSLTVLALVSPLDVVGDHFLLSAHMLQHVLLGDAAPALMLVALRGPLLYFSIPRPLLRALGRLRLVRRGAGWLTRPKVALAVWAAAYGGWHVPAAYDYATRHQIVHDTEHASFVVAGLLVWTLLVDPARHARLSRSQRLGVAATLFLMGTIISDILIFSPRALYPAYADQAERVFRLSPLRDQQLAGLVMTVDQMLTLGTFAAFLLWPALRGRRLARRSVAQREQPA